MRQRDDLDQIKYITILKRFQQKTDKNLKGETKIKIQTHIT